MQKIVLNGANGYVASYLINELLLRNYEVAALVRNSNEFSSAGRMKNALAGISKNENVKFKNLKVYNYSLLEEDFSIPKKKIEDIFGEKVDYFHFAASLKYNTKDRHKIFETNVDGVENSIKVFLKYSSPGSRFFLISSAYSCGKFSGVFEEKFYKNETISHFRNYYEQSKRYAENTVKKYIDKDNLNGHIIRLSQVVGNNKTGITKTDYGVFDFVKRMYSLTKKYPGETVRIRINPDSTQNLIPIDNVVSYILKILNTKEVLPPVFNFTAKNDIKNSNIIQHICKLLPVNIILDKTLERENLNAIERLVAAGMSFTGGYVDTHLLFDRKNLDKIVLPDENEVTVQSLYNMLAYFIHELSVEKTMI